MRAQRNLDGSIWAYSYADGTERWMHVPGVSELPLRIVRRGGSRGARARNADRSRAIIEDTYQRAVLPMALHAHGDEVIHASAVLMEDGVVAFCGRSQTGKSTVAYGLHRRGCRVWADDTLVFDASDEVVQAIPYPHRLRIRAEAAEYFDLHELRRRDTSSWTALEQAQAEPGAAWRASSCSSATSEAGTPVETVRLTPAEALAGVIEHAYWFRLDDAERTRRMIGKYLVLATQVPVFRMRFRAALDQLPEMLDQAESVVRAAATEP